MWDLKLIFFDSLFIINLNSYDLFNYIINTLNPEKLNGLVIHNFKIYYQFAQNMTIFFAIKFLICIFFLILIRGGTPRYRYDFLTKLGWLKFIGLTLMVFTISISTLLLF